MEFEEIQEIWDQQKKQPMYTINEQELQSRILAKKSQAGHIANVSELLLIVVNLLVGGGIAVMNSFGRDRNVFLYVVAAWMVGTGGYMLVSRVRRLRRLPLFDRTMRGDLEHAIADASYQVRISQLMRWNIFPIAAFIVAGMWEGGKSIWIGAGTVVFMGMAYYASGFEHRFYKRKRKELGDLYNQLERSQY